MKIFISKEEEKEKAFIARTTAQWYWDSAPYPQYEPIDWQSYNKSKPENICQIIENSFQTYLKDNTKQDVEFVVEIPLESGDIVKKVYVVNFVTFTQYLSEDYECVRDIMRKDPNGKITTKQNCGGPLADLLDKSQINTTHISSQGMTMA